MESKPRSSLLCGGYARGSFMPERIKHGKDTKGLQGHVNRIHGAMKGAEARAAGSGQRC